MRMNLASVDLRLLVVFDAILVERSVSRAARRLGLSQPAVSSALNRLRDLLGDQLFVRTQGGMEPTLRTLELSVPLQGALRQIESALEPIAFSPGDERWMFELALSNHASVVLLPSLIEHVGRTAPDTRLRFQSRRNVEVPQLLDASEADVAIGVIPDLQSRFHRTTLFRDRYVCMMRRDHPLAGRPLTRADLERTDHLAIRPGSLDVSRVDRMLEGYGVRRRVVTSVHQFLAAPGIVERSDLLALVFERMTGVFDLSRFYLCEVPVPDMGVDVDLVWSRVHTDKPAHRWLRRQVQIACAGLPELGSNVTGRVPA